MQAVILTKKKLDEMKSAVFKLCRLSLKDPFSPDYLYFHTFELERTGLWDMFLLCTPMEGHLHHHLFCNKRKIIFNPYLLYFKNSRVKSGGLNFGHQGNLDIHLQKVEIQMRRLLMSCLIRIFTVRIVNKFLLQ